MSKRGTPVRKLRVLEQIQIASKRRFLDPHTLHGVEVANDVRKVRHRAEVVYDVRCRALEGDSVTYSLLEADVLLENLPDNVTHVGVLRHTSIYAQRTREVAKGEPLFKFLHIGHGLHTEKGLHAQVLREPEREHLSLDIAPRELRRQLT